MARVIQLGPWNLDPGNVGSNPISSLKNWWILEGVEPSIQDCKSSVFPITPQTQKRMMALLAPSCFL